MQSRQVRRCECPVRRVAVGCALRTFDGLTLADFTGFKEGYANTQDAERVERGIGGDLGDLAEGDDLLLGECVAGPEELEVGDDGVEHGEDPRGAFGRGSADVVVGEQADEVDGGTEQEGKGLIEARGEGNREGGEDEHAAERHGGSVDGLHVAEVGCGGLKLPVLRDEQDEDEGDCAGGDDPGGEGGGEVPAVNVIAEAGGDQADEYGEAGEEDDGLIEVIGGGHHDAMPDGHEEYEGEEVVADEYGGADAEVFADEEKGAADGFGHDRHDGEGFDFARDDVGGAEGAGQETVEQEGGQADVEEDFVVAFALEGEGGQRGVEDEQAGGNPHEDAEDGLTDRLDKGCPGDGDQFAEHGLGRSSLGPGCIGGRRRGVQLCRGRGRHTRNHTQELRAGSVRRRSGFWSRGAQ